MDNERAGIDRNQTDLNATLTANARRHLLPLGNHLSAGLGALHNKCRCDSWNLPIHAATSKFIEQPTHPLWQSDCLMWVTGLL